MKIGIVTFFCVPNYGAMLQAYSLWKFLEEHGHSVEFIDYPFGNSRRIPLWKCFLTRNISNWFDEVRKKLQFFVRFEIVRFSDSFPRTKRVSTFEKLLEFKEKYDAVIVGSDQMWNPTWFSGSYLPIVMLDFTADSVRRISFAVSFGTKEWREDQNANKAGQLLQKFDAISVREKSGLNLVLKLSGRNDAKWMIDPTLLHTIPFYEPLFSNEKYLSHRYIFTYMLDEWLNGENIETVVQLVKDWKGIDEVHTDKIPVKGILSPICKIFDVQSKITIGKWLFEIANADFIVTNSFHGTVFSLLFHKPFLAIVVSGSMAGMNERIMSLLTMVGLESRIVNIQDITGCIDIINNAINWSVVDQKLDFERIKANVFINNVLM